MYLIVRHVHVHAYVDGQTQTAKTNYHQFNHRSQYRQYISNLKRRLNVLMLLDDDKNKVYKKKAK